MPRTRDRADPRPLVLEDSRYAALVPLMNSSCILLFGVGAGCAGGTAENALAGNVRIAAVEPGVHWLGAPDRYIADAPLHPPVEAVEKLTTPDEYLGANALIARPARPAACLRIVASS